ncbi:MAG: T9SS type A sorting domain-containing protein [Bacteroidia bacterium]
MKTKLLLLSLTSGLLFSQLANAQRYLTEVFTDAQISITDNVVYARNHQFFPPTTTFPVDSLRMRVYQPSQTVDTENARPVMVYIHTGNFLPPIINGGVGGSINDSAAVNLCKQWAKRGYVVIAPSYRLGWNPLATSELERRVQLLNAVYRAINDIKASVRFMRKTEDVDGNPYKIDPDKFVLYGQGSGGYVALAYVTLDKFAEMAIPGKFTLPNGNSMIDTNAVGNIDGFGGQLNVSNWPGYSSSVSMSINAGGALADTSWLEAGDVPMVSFHAVRDPFAPYGNGTVIVPTTNENVVDVSGAGIFINKAYMMGNQVGLEAALFTDPVSVAARARYNQTIDYIYPAPFNTINVGGGEGLFPIIRPIRNQISVFANEGDPWTWWDSTTLTLVVAAVNAQTGGNYNAQQIHMSALAGNPGMSAQKGLTFIDTIQRYIHPRIVNVLGLPGNNVSVKEVTRAQAKVNVYPNPATDFITVRALGENDRICEVELIDIIGKRVRIERNIMDEYYRVQRNDLPAGMYFVRVITEKGEATHKVTFR